MSSSYSLQNQIIYLSYPFSSSLILFCSCGTFYVCEWILTDKILMTSVSDDDGDISTMSLITNLTLQFLNTLLISCIIIGYNLFLYLGGLVIIFRLKTVSETIKDLPKYETLVKGDPELWRRDILILCHSMHVDVS